MPTAHTQSPLNAAMGAAARSRRGGAMHDAGKDTPAEGGGPAAPAPAPVSARPNAMIDCGWGRLMFAPSFESPARLAAELQQEAAGRRDIALYVEAPQLVLAEAPQTLFLDPSLLFRRALEPGQDAVAPAGAAGATIRRLSTRADIAAINRLYASRHMVPLDPATVWRQRDHDAVVYLVAEDEHTGDIIGSAMGVDHLLAFGDERGGSSLWCLVVDPQTHVAGVGQALVRELIALFASRGRRHLDLSVLHDNQHAIGLYHKLGFVQVDGFVVKHKNAINEPLFAGASECDNLNPYAALIVKEARRRGIGVDIIDAECGIFSLRFGGREVMCRESLSELTGAVAMTWCQDKALTRKRLVQAGLQVPAQRHLGTEEENRAFLAEHGSVVVKPAFGEQGRGISVDVRTEDHLRSAIDAARKEGGNVLLEAFCPGQDLRIVVIGYEVVAAAIRKPAEVVGDGQSDLRTLIERHSARRSAATGGESRIPMDAETERCLAAQGLSYESVPAAGERVPVRKTANLHTGGTLHDVTDQLHPVLKDAAQRAARALRIPVVGLDFLVPAADQPDYVIIEANERPGLANHEPQPTAERFIDLLFPFTA
ncbi:GNAT-family acetyltransferase (TIGR03103 family) [Cupriavidus gilardii J11]|uniref:GNAT-family acetyltransferase (TIGR03103 family) n=1 Tax=Cupriavidus gilardii J11 TaxID=936133 RepID=A0A562BRF7_9BURK|nr:N-acetylglutaminylglutamine synthetase [Cupriavidus gilardii]TWG87479.1 GNAT-family acetyltransferase (TIGR03103 family) [Cupriavidus gilardii J11]